MHPKKRKLFKIVNFIVKFEELFINVIITIFCRFVVGVVVVFADVAVVVVK